MATGGCQCGAVRYETVGEPNRAGVCECRMCQRATGAFLYADAQYEPDRVRWTGEARRRFRSSSAAERGFCGNCGTTLTYENLVTGSVSVMIATLDDPDSVRPTDHDGIEGRPSWLDGVLAKPGAPTGAMPDDFEDYQFKAPGDAIK